MEDRIACLTTDLFSSKSTIKPFQIAHWMAWNGWGEWEAKRAIGAKTCQSHSNLLLPLRFMFPFLIVRFDSRQAPS